MRAIKYLAFVVAFVCLVVSAVEAGQSQGGTKARPICWTWGNVVNVQISSSPMRGVSLQSLYIVLRDWDDSIGWFSYTTVVVQGRTSLPLALVQEQASAALGNPAVALQILTLGACNQNTVYNPNEVIVYDVTPVEVEPETSAGDRG